MLSATRASSFVQWNDCAPHSAGASLRQIAKASGLGRKTVTAIVEADSPRT